MTHPINKTMNRADLFTREARPIVEGINRLIHELYGRNLSMTSWHGTLERDEGSAWSTLKRSMQRLFGCQAPRAVGLANRGPTYEPLPDAADDDRIPWYLYWEIAWVLVHGPALTPGMRLLDAGGTSSLFTCYLASLGCEVHSVDLNEALVANGNRIAQAMGWRLHSYAMNMGALDLPDAYFDHAYSICVFEHLDLPTKDAALREIARCLRPGGVLSVTFDYRNPAPYVVGFGPDTRAQNQITTPEDVTRTFLSTGGFEMMGNREFSDDGTSWLVHPRVPKAPYTFGAVFLRKR